MTPYYDHGGITIYRGDCREIMAALPAASVDHILTDPPYGLEFMGKGWDRGVPGAEFWEAALRVAKPGAMLMAFGGTRTHHRLMCAIEDAGWEIRDCLMWLYGSGFPKSLDISKAIDKAAGAAECRTFRCKNPADRPGNNGTGVLGETPTTGNGWRKPRRPDKTNPATDAAKLWDGWGTALKPAWEPIILAMKPCDGTFANNALKHGVAGLNVDGGRVRSNGPVQSAAGAPGFGNDRDDGYAQGEGRVYENTKGRWPANLILDEVAGAILDEDHGPTSVTGRRTQRSKSRWVSAESPLPGQGTTNRKLTEYAGSPSNPSRFFYCAKASRKERGEGNTHPTVKPLALMRYLLTLLSTPTGGVVLDPFTGSGSTLVAARQLGRKAIGIEIEEKYCEIAAKRLGQEVFSF